MNEKSRLRHLGRLFKLFVLGSFVATRTAAGSADPEDALRHELAWMTVRDGMTDVMSGSRLAAEIHRIVQQEIEKDLDFRVAYTYRAISPDAVAQLDALWMDHLVDHGVGADEIDRFLGARTVALRQVVNDQSQAIDSPEYLQKLVREFNVAGYTE